MKTNFMRSLSAVLAVLLAMTLSFAVLADESSVATSDEASVESTVESSVAESAEESSAEESKETSSEASKETSKETSSEASKEESNSSNNAATEEPVKDFPWARVITLIVIVVLVAVAIILSKTNTAIGQRIAKFFKEYASEIKKVSWYSPKDTAKATAIVLVILIVAAIVIGLLDLGFTQLIKLIANIF